MTEAFVVDGVRTPIGRYGGLLSSVRPDDLAAIAVAELVARSGIDPTMVDDVIFGAANQAGEDNRNVARMAVLLAGLPDSVPGITVNRLCASGLSAVHRSRCCHRRRCGVDDARPVDSGQAGTRLQQARGNRRFVTWLAIR
jgi:acetyl-CoA acetyltransferase